MTPRPFINFALFLLAPLCLACATPSPAGGARAADPPATRSAETAAPPAAEPPAAPRESAAGWSELSLRAQCEAMNPAYCAGHAGFTVRSDGSYRIGPDQQGHALQGPLAPEEQSRLNAAVAALGPLAPASSPLCHQRSVPGSGRSLTLHAAAGDVLVYATGFVEGPSCEGERGEKVLALLGVVQDLLGRYYPRPFPPKG